MLRVARLLVSSKLTIYRGLSAYNKNGHYWTPDREWARQFTQSGRDSEIKTSTIDTSVILRMDPLPRAYNEGDFDKALAEARAQGFKAVWFNEGSGEPESIYVL